MCFFRFAWRNVFLSVNSEDKLVEVNRVRVGGGGGMRSRGIKE